MYNRVSCALSNRTMESYDGEELTMFFTAVSTGGEVGKINTPLPFIFDMKFEDGFIPLNKESRKNFRRLAYFILKELSPTIISIETKEEQNFKYSFNEYPSESDIDAIANALSSFPSDQYEVVFTPTSIKTPVSIVPFIADKKQFDIFKETDFNVNHFIKKKEDLYKWVCNLGFSAKKRMKESEGTESEQYLSVIMEALRTNNFKNIESNLLGDVFYFQAGIFRSIGLYGRGKKSQNSFYKTIDTFWVLYKMIIMNVNMSQASNPYPNHLANDNLIEYHEKVLAALKEKLKTD